MTDDPDTAEAPPETVLVVVPALDEADAIEPCLASLLEGDPFAAAARVVVADGGSTDGTQGIVARLARRWPNVHLMGNPQRLQSAGINAAVAAQAGPGQRYLVRCDAHAVYPPGYVRDVVAALAADPARASVVTPMDAIGTTAFARAAALAVDTPLGSGGAAHRGGRGSRWVDHGHHAGFRLDWFRRIGGYDETFSHNEDAEYDHRLALAGGRVWLDGTIRLDYRMRSSPRALARQYWNYGRGRARTVRKHAMTPRLRQVVPAINLVLLVVALLVAPMAPAALAWPALYAAVLAATSVWGAVRLRSADGFWAGVALAAMHLSWGAGFLWELAAPRRPAPVSA